MLLALDAFRRFDAATLCCAELPDYFMRFDAAVYAYAFAVFAT